MTNALTCQKCGAALDSSSLDRRLGIITCAHCNSIFDLVTQRPSKDAQDKQDSVDFNQEFNPEQASQKHKAQKPYRAPAALPPGYSLSVQGDTLLIEKKWRQNNSLKSSLFTLFFAIIWLGVIATQFGVILFSHSPIIVQLFLIPFLGVGVSLFYRSLAQIFNVTTFSLDQSQFNMTHGPLPWYPKRQYNSKDIEQIYIKQHKQESYNKNSNNVKIYYRYSLHCILRNGQSEILINDLQNIEQALFLEQEIEQHLKIRDRAVAGEYVAQNAQH